MAERLVTDTLVNGQEKYLPLTADQYRQRFNAIAELPDLNEQVRFHAHWAKSIRRLSPLPCVVAEH
jgi:hypothetical protein